MSKVHATCKTREIRQYGATLMNSTDERSGVSFRRRIYTADRRGVSRFFFVLFRMFRGSSVVQTVKAIHELREQQEKKGLFSLITFHCSLLLDKHNRLRTRNFESAATLFARQHVVNSDHVVARFLIAHPIVLVGATRRRRLLSSFQPANFVFHPFAAIRTTVGCLLRFLSLVKKILFVHIRLVALRTMHSAVSREDVQSSTFVFPRW